MTNLRIFPRCKKMLRCSKLHNNSSYSISVNFELSPHIHWNSILISLKVKLEYHHRLHTSLLCDSQLCLIFNAKKKVIREGCLVDEGGKGIENVNCETQCLFYILVFCYWNVNERWNIQWNSMWMMMFSFYINLYFFSFTFRQNIILKVKNGRHVNWNFL